MFLSNGTDGNNNLSYIYITATESDEKSDNIKTSIFLTCIGKQGLEIYNTFTRASDEEKMKLKPVMEKFEAYCKPRKNITLIRHHFFTYRQSEGQSFDGFVTEQSVLQHYRIL